MCAWVCCVGLQSLSPSLPSLASVPPLMDEGNKGSFCCPPPKESKQTGTKPLRAGAAVRLLQAGWAAQPEVCLKHGCAHVNWEEQRKEKLPGLTERQFFCNKSLPGSAFWVCPSVGCARSLVVQALSVLGLPECLLSLVLFSWVPNPEVHLQSFFLFDKSHETVIT